MPSTALSPVPRTYAELRRAVEVTMVKGQQAVEQTKVRTYWETGRLIKEHGPVAQLEQHLRTLAPPMETDSATVPATGTATNDRYLADVFLEQDGEPVFLNNALLVCPIWSQCAAAQRLAVPVVTIDPKFAVYGVPVVA